MFKNYHYLDGNINKTARCYVGIWNDEIVAFSANLAFPSGNFKNGWRGHRTVVLPDYQGMGIGVRFSDTIAQIHLEQGYKYFSRTAHPRMGQHRENSPLWKATTKNKKKRSKVKIEGAFNGHFVDDKRLCYSHEYIGYNLDNAS